VREYSRASSSPDDDLMIFVKTISTVLISAALGGCVMSRYTSQYPILPQVTDRDPGLSCTLLDDEILRANALRNAIYEEHGDFMDQAEEMETGAWDIYRAAQHNPRGAIVDWILRERRTEDRSGQYMEAAGPAGQRLEQLLIYKDERGCPTGRTQDSMMTDSTILADLMFVREELRNDEVSHSQYASDRRQLLDTLR